MDEEALEKSKACQEKAAALEESRNQKKLLDRMQCEVEQLSVEKYQMNQMIERNNDEKAKILREKTELLLIAIKHNKLMREARERCIYIKYSKSFRKCHQAVDPERFIKTCISDICSTTFEV